MSNSQTIVELIYNYHLSIECHGGWFLVYQGQQRPVNSELKRVGFFTWRHEETINLDKALAYSLSVSDAVREAVKNLKARCGYE